MIPIMPIRLRLHRLALLLVLVLCLPLAARADDASRRAKAAQLVVLLHTERMVQQNSATIMKQVSDAAEKEIGPNPTPENKARLAGLENKISQMIDAQLDWKALGPAIIDIYAQTFTEPELDVIVTFYKTPAGIALLDKMPRINDQIEQLAHSRLVILQPQIRQAFDDFRKSQAPPPPAASPAAAPAAAPAPAAASPASAASKPSTSSPK
jgi:hypothetical protein